MKKDTFKKRLHRSSTVAGVLLKFVPKQAFDAFRIFLIVATVNINAGEPLRNLAILDQAGVRRYADADDPLAMFVLGYRYHFGLGIGRDREWSKNLVLEASSKGNKAALGFAYLEQWIEITNDAEFLKVCAETLNVTNRLVNGMEEFKSDGPGRFDALNDHYRKLEIYCKALRKICPDDVLVRRRYLSEKLVFSRMLRQEEPYGMMLHEESVFFESLDVAILKTLRELGVDLLIDPRTEMTTNEALICLRECLESDRSNSGFGPGRIQGLPSNKEMLEHMRSDNFDDSGLLSYLESLHFVSALSEGVEKDQVSKEFFVLLDVLDEVNEFPEGYSEEYEKLKMKFSR